MPTTFGYRAALRLGVAMIPAVALVHPKTRAGHAGRRGAVARLRAWSAATRDLARPLAWFHAPSVGEGRQAESVLARFRAQHPSCQIVYTHFSPSAAALAQHLDVEVHDYLPYDTPGAADALLAALRPDLLVFTKLDLWPELATRAAAHGTAVACIAATVSPGSGRLRWPVRSWLTPGYASVAAAAAVSDDDARRLARLGVAPGRIEVLGDPRYDSVDARVRAARSDDSLLRFGGGLGTVVAGSTWPRDEAVVLDAFARVRRQYPEARLILAPHEPTSDHLARIERSAARYGLPAPMRLSAATVPSPFLLVDRVGVLAVLYGAGDAAYVGGGYGSAGLHSVLEPAAWAMPVVFGPSWRNSRDAEILLGAGAAAALGRDDGAAGMARWWTAWIEDENARQAMGRRARKVVDEGLGAAERTATALSRLLRRLPLGAPPTRR